MEAVVFLPSTRSHHALQLKVLFELSNNSDAPILRRVWVMYFYSWGQPHKSA